MAEGDTESIRSRTLMAYEPASVVEFVDGKIRMLSPLTAKYRDFASAMLSRFDRDKGWLILQLPEAQELLASMDNWVANDDYLIEGDEEKRALLRATLLEHPPPGNRA